MKTKILLLFVSFAALSGCTTAYKNSQTPDDVYYSPIRTYESDNNDDRDRDKRYEPSRDYEIVMGIRDRRWRDFRDEYEYNNSPYYYTCNHYNYGYYYNPYYYPWAIYTVKPTYKPLNTTPRMVNLNAYNGYNPAVANSKTNGVNWTNGSNRYNNSNSNPGSRTRQILYPRSSSSSSSSSNDTRTYSPSSSSGSSSGSSSSGSSSGSSVSRPGRG